MGDDEMKQFEGYIIDEVPLTELLNPESSYDPVQVIVNYTGYYDIRGEIALLLAIIHQAVVDRDWEWLGGPTCVAICRAFGLQEDLIKTYVEKLYDESL